MVEKTSVGMIHKPNPPDFLAFVIIFEIFVRCSTVRWDIDGRSQRVGVANLQLETEEGGLEPPAEGRREGGLEPPAEGRRVFPTLSYQIIFRASRSSG